VEVGKELLDHYEPGDVVNALYARRVALSAHRDPDRSATLGLADRDSAVIDQLVDDQISKVGGTPPQQSLFTPKTPGDALFSGILPTNAWEAAGGSVAALRNLLAMSEHHASQQTTAPWTFGMQIGGYSPSMYVGGIQYSDAGCC